VRDIYTYGQPMVGNTQFAKLFGRGPSYVLLAKGLFRHVDDRDGVPSLPPKEAGEFVHIGAEYGAEQVDGRSHWRGNTKPREQAKLFEFALSFLAFVTKQLPGGKWRKSVTSAAFPRPWPSLRRRAPRDTTSMGPW
jgi:hypothetical protein